MGSRTLHNVTVDSAMVRGSTFSSHRSAAADRNSRIADGVQVRGQEAMYRTSGRSSAANSVPQRNTDTTEEVLPPNSVPIPGAASKRKMKDSDRPGVPTGPLLSARVVFNRLYQQKLNRSLPIDDNFPIYPEMSNAIKDAIRQFLYQRLGLERGQRTFSSIRLEFASQLSQLKRRLSETFPVLSAAQNNWVSTEFVKEAMQRDKKATAEAKKRNAKSSSAAPAARQSRSVSIMEAPSLRDAHTLDAEAGQRPPEHRLDSNTNESASTVRVNPQLEQQQQEEEPPASHNDQVNRLTGSQEQQQGEEPDDDQREERGMSRARAGGVGGRGGIREARRGRTRNHSRRLSQANARREDADSDYSREFDEDEEYTVGEGYTEGADDIARSHGKGRSSTGRKEPRKKFIQRRDVETEYEDEDQDVEAFDNTARKRGHHYEAIARKSRKQRSNAEDRDDEEESDQDDITPAPKRRRANDTSVAINGRARNRSRYAKQLHALNPSNRSNRSKRPNRST